MTVQDILDRLKVALVDESHTLWTEAELLGYINDALSALVIARPDLGFKTHSYNSASKSIEKPTDYYRFETVQSAGGIAIQFVDIHKLNQLEPTWRTATGMPYCWTRYDDHVDEVFLVPAPSEAIDIEIIYSAHLAVSIITDVLPVPAIYEGLILDFVLYRAFSKTGQGGSDMNKALSHQNSFYSTLGQKQQVDISRLQLQEKKENSR
ncbi:DUF6682 family protein [Vibrio breoganii]|uniref:Uncharacterized protein n=1 Tax=Vibrio breoganii TaxID=553239 RepID=A0AAP8MVH6_9VIBR|nr:DUF6682 family protein [Vibrio breoganii]PMP10214.1 hypothetical protein BCS93_11100 [Vibrio breoganii]